MFDSHGRVQLTPVELYQRATEDPRSLINHILTRATPVAFEDYSKYCAFLEEVSAGLHVHPRNIFVRGSCQLGYSISPRQDKVWMEMTRSSDVDLAVVDVDYFNRLNRELMAWEEENGQLVGTGNLKITHESRVRNRGYRCVDDQHFPKTVCVWHTDCMERLPLGKYCQQEGGVTTFVFRDWWALRSRYELDLRELVNGVRNGVLVAPEAKARPRAKGAAK